MDFYPILRVYLVTYLHGFLRYRTANSSARISSRSEAPYSSRVSTVTVHSGRIAHLQFAVFAVRRRELASRIIGRDGLRIRRLLLCVFTLVGRLRAVQLPFNGLAAQLDNLIQRFGFGLAVYPLVEFIKAAAVYILVNKLLQIGVILIIVRFVLSACQRKRSQRTHCRCAVYRACGAAATAHARRRQAVYAGYHGRFE